MVLQAARVTLGATKCVDVINSSQQPQQVFEGVEREPRKAADQRAVEADVLQVAADVDFDQRNQRFFFRLFISSLIAMARI